MVCVLYKIKSTSVSTHVYQCKAFVEMNNSYYISYCLTRYYGNPMIDKADCKTKRDNPDLVLKIHDVTSNHIIAIKVSSYCAFYTRRDIFFSFYSTAVFIYLYLYLFHGFCHVTLRFVVGLFLITACLEL